MCVNDRKETESVLGSPAADAAVYLGTDLPIAGMFDDIGPGGHDDRVDNRLGVTTT